MTTLHDRLADLADGVAAGSEPAGPSDLWVRGRRWQRRRWAGTVTVVTVACVLLGGLGWQVWERGRQDEVVLPAGAPAALPDRVWEPSGSLPGTASAGPPGRVALTMRADRAGWWGSTPGVVAVSAETGRYAFLDLPGHAEGSDTAVSPDGRYLAYWRSGTPSGSPPEDGPAVTGFAVYDAGSGEIRAQDVDTAHGLSPDSLVFADNVTLVAAFGQRAGGRGDDPEDQAMSLDAPLWRWALTEDEAVPDPALTELVAGRSLDGGAYGHLWWPGDGGNTHDLVDAHHPERGVRSIPVRATGLLYTAAVDRSGRRVAAVARLRNPNRVVWGSATVPEQTVPGSGRTSQVLGWLDDSHLVVLRSTNTDQILDPGVWVLDLDGSDTRELVHPARRDSELRLGGSTDPVLDCCSTRDVAWQLASEPTFRATAPPEPLDQRLVWGGGLAAVVVAGLAMVGWRRRVQP